MPTQIKHNGGLVDAVLELGFDAVKYFEISATGVAQMLTISPPARRLTLRNASTSVPAYFNITGDDAVAAASSTPGDNIKLGPECTFEMDFDTLKNISFITGGGTALIEGWLGWKGSVCYPQT
jgi:hypothetical protein